jgi:hypothetical protein
MRFLFFFISLFFYPNLFAQWNSNPSVNNLIIANTNGFNQTNNKILPDASGGAIIVGSRRVQKINANALPQWGGNGVAFGSDEVSIDGSGGLYGTSSSGNGINVQKLNSSGVSQWYTVVGNGSYNPIRPTIINDGTGGAFVAWVYYDFNNQNSGYFNQYYMQRVSASGSAKWASNGVPMINWGDVNMQCQLIASSPYQAMLSTASRLNVRKIDTTGMPNWPHNTFDVGGYNQHIIPDGNGGAFIVWELNYVYVQKIDSNGTKLWPGNGVRLSNTGTDYQQTYPRVTPDGTGGCIATWTDTRNSNSDIFAQKISSNGTVQWVASGRPVCTITGSQLVPDIASDGAGGAIITWQDFRSGTNDIYAQRLGADGSYFLQNNGLPVCNATGNQVSPKIISDGAGGGIISWKDDRSGTGIFDIYASRLFANGTLCEDGYVTPDVTISASQNPICLGTSVLFTATPTSGGTAPTYQWLKNNIIISGATGSTYSSTTLIHNDTINCVLTSNAPCATKMIDTSNKIGVTVSPVRPRSFFIYTTNTSNTYCEGVPITFQLSPPYQAEIPFPTYQWMRNGVNIPGEVGATYISGTLVNGDVIRCVLTFAYPCENQSIYTTPPFVPGIITRVVPTVEITSSAPFPACQGTSVTFTATTNNLGAEPSIIWYKNGEQIGYTNTYTSTNLVNGDTISCRAFPSPFGLQCTTIPFATSNKIVAAINPIITPAITISTTTAIPICAGSNISFVAVATNGGSTPTYQWRRNNVNIGGATTNTYSSTSIAHNDTISCILTSNANCVSPLIVTSNKIGISLYPTSTANISASANAVCMGTTITLAATAGNAGASPSYQWLKNGAIINGANTSSYAANNFANNDTISCRITPSSGCLNPVISNSIILKINPLPLATITGSGCTGTATIASTFPIEKVQWRFKGVNVSGSPSFVSWLPTPAVVAGNGTVGSGLNQLNVPLHALVDAYGNIYVSDGGNNRVVKWLPGATSGIVVAGGNGAGAALNQLNYPKGIWLDYNGNLFVAEQNNHRVTKWVPGATAAIIVAGGNGQGAALNQLNAPYGVSGDNNGNIYISDESNFRVMRWAAGASSGTIVAGGNGPGSGANQLYSPVGLYVSGDGTVYVTEGVNSRVSKWVPGATSGVIVAGGNGAGSNVNQLSYPISVFLDKNNVLYVSDFDNNRVTRWPQNGVAPTVVASSIVHPRSTSITDNGDMFILEDVNGRVLKYSVSATPFTRSTYYDTASSTAGEWDAIVHSFGGCSYQTSKYYVSLNSYTFTGNGNWNVPSNWSSNAIPPPNLPSCSEILIDPVGSGECILNLVQHISTGAKITVKTGKKFRVTGNLILQ